MLFINALRNILQTLYNALCVLCDIAFSYLRTPSNPRNYNALYRIISRRSFSLHPGGFRGVSSCVLAVWICTRCIVAILRRCVDLGGIYSGGLVFFSRPKRRTCGGCKDYISYICRCVLIYLYIIRNGHNKICAFAICKQTDVSHANRRHWAACVSAGRASDGVRCVAAVCVACGYQRGASVHTGGGTPPVGAPGQGTPPFSEFFLFFFEEGGRKPYI